MSKVRVRFFGRYSSITGKREENITVPKGTTVRELLDKLGEKYGPSFGEGVWSPKGELRRELRLFLGQEEVSGPDLDKPVPEEVSFFVLTGLGGGILAWPSSPCS